MSHEAYAPVGYTFNADQYCLDCIVRVAAGGISTSSSSLQGFKRDECDCPECRLDRMAEARNIDRYDERSFDSGDFPKAIPYHNDLHSDCEQDSCYGRCGACGDVIDGESTLYGPDKCPVHETASERIERMRG